MKYIKFLVFAIAAVTVTSCDDEFLNPLPDTVVSLDSFFASDDDVLAGIHGVYDALQGTNESTVTNIGTANRGVQFEHLLTEHRTDNSRNATLEGSKSDFHRYIVDASNVESEDYYQSMYEVIFRANNILTNYLDVADASNQASYAAELKFLRAYAYFKLVRLFGDVPLVTAPVDPTNTEALFTRIAQAQVYEQIVADLQEAVDVLDNSHKGRASRAAAQGILAKVYLSQASPNYSGAEALLEAIIGSGGFSLEPNFSDVFYRGQLDDDGNLIDVDATLSSEVIFTIQYQSVNSTESQGFSAEFTSSTRAGREDGQNIVNLNLFNDFAAFGGSRTVVSITDLGFLENDENEVTKFLPEGTDLSASPIDYGVGRNAGNDYIALRYADVLLMHVEATMAGGPATVDPAALTSFQEVRNRAGLTTPVGSVTKSDLLTERRVELAFENQRYFDLIRFGEFDNVLSAHSDEMGYIYSASKARFLPIPQRERNLSGGLLTQNPGY